MNIERDLELAREERSRVGLARCLACFQTGKAKNIQLVQLCGRKKKKTSIAYNFSTFSCCMSEIKHPISCFSQRWYYVDFKPEFLYHNLDFVQSYSVP